MSDAITPDITGGSGGSERGLYPPPAPDKPLVPASAKPGMKAGETMADMYARQTRNATVTIAVFVVISAIISVIAGIMVAIAASHFNSLYDQGSFSGNTTNSNCASQGGTDFTC